MKSTLTRAASYLRKDFAGTTKLRAPSFRLTGVPGDRSSSLGWSGERVGGYGPKPPSVIKRAGTVRTVILRTCLFLLLLCTAHAQDVSQAQGSQLTVSRWSETAWWPTNGAPALSEYAGSDSCSSCHRGIAATQRTTPMFYAARRPSESELLQRHADLSFSESGYSYSLSRRPTSSILLIENDTATISEPVDWAFGSGEVAQTYVLKRDDKYIESRVTYYSNLAALGITTGHSSIAPASLEQALGDSIDSETAHRCFGCHSTASTTSGKFDPGHATLGLTCEACHGPGAKHVAAMNSDNPVSAAQTIFSAKKLSPVDSVDFCGACHRTPVDVAVEMPAHMGIATLRFQPYRLERSLCWGAKGDARITCVACHDPHQPLVRDLAAYDAKCLRCHAGKGEAASATRIAGCTVGTKECASCHMPKYEIPAVHATFTDHYIRIVRPGSGFRP